MNTSFESHMVKISNFSKGEAGFLVSNFKKKKFHDAHNAFFFGMPKTRKPAKSYSYHCMTKYKFLIEMKKKMIHRKNTPFGIQRVSLIFI